LFAWLTLLPDCTVFPVSSQRRAINKILNTQSGPADASPKSERPYGQNPRPGQASPA